MNTYDDTNPSSPARHDNVKLGDRVPQTAVIAGLSVGNPIAGYSGTSIPCIVVSSSAPVNGDGRPDGTLYIQTA